MAKSNSTPKARKTTITLGDIQVDGYEIPPVGSGKYICSKKQVVDLLDLDWRRFAQLVKLNLAQTLLPQGLEVRAISTEVGRIDGIPVEQVPIIWVLAASRGNVKALLLTAACTSESLERRFDKNFGRLTSEQERDERLLRRSRIVAPCPWERMYEPDLCNKIQSWYGFDSSKFWWWYCYSFFTPEEKAELEKHNPLVKVTSRNGATRTTRKFRIHQNLSQSTRDRLSDFATHLWRLVELCDSRTEFEKKWNKKYGQPTQLEIFDLWDFAS